MNQEKSNKSKVKVSSKQIVAWIGIILLVALYVVTLFVAIFDRSESMHLFAACLFASLLVPFVIWIYSWLYDRIIKSKNQENE